MSATKPISMPGYLLGVLAGTVVCVAFIVIDFSKEEGVTLFSPLGMFWSELPAMWLANLLVGLPVFIVLRTLSPARGLGRLAFVVLIAAPIVILAPCLVGAALLMHSYFPKPVIFEAIPLITVFGGMVCWAIDQVSLLVDIEGKSAAGLGSLLQSRPMLRRLVCGTFLAVEWVVALCLSITLLAMYPALHSALSAPRIVFALAYCALSTTGPCPLP
jgi:hypothetical protein